MMQKLTQSELEAFIFEKGPFTRKEAEKYSSNGVRHYLRRMTLELEALGEQEFLRQAKEDPSFKEFGEEALLNPIGPDPVDPANPHLRLRPGKQGLSLLDLPSQHKSSLKI